MLLLFLIGIAFVVYCNHKVNDAIQGRVFDEIDSIPSSYPSLDSQVGILMFDNSQEEFHNNKKDFETVLDSIVSLFNKTKIRSLIISSPKESKYFKYVKDSLVKRGIPKYRIIDNDEGLNAFDVIKVIPASSFVLISQQEINERVVYMYHQLGLDSMNADVSLYAYNIPNMPKKNLHYVIDNLVTRTKIIWDSYSSTNDSIRKNKFPFLPYKFDNNITRGRNSIDGHNEQDTIIGNFTGHSIDTLFVESVDTGPAAFEECFYLRSNNKKIPRIKLITNIVWCPPMLVNEGDLDGNGTCEVGYLPTWGTSQFREYLILTLVKNEWRYLVVGNYLMTPEWFRHTGCEIAEPGKAKGTVLIHYAYEGYDEKKKERFAEIRDTIVKPTFTKIDNLNYR